MPEPHSAMRRPALRHGAVEAHASGVTLPVNAAEVLASGAVADRFIEQAYDVLASRGPLGVRILGLGNGPEAQLRFTRLCMLLRAVVTETHVAGAKVEITIGAGAMTPQAAWLIRSRMLGFGAVYLLADATQIRPAGARLDTPFWQQLWQLRSNGRISAAYASTVTPSSPLLSVETADTIQPGCALQVPVGSAWVTTQVDLPGYADESGAIDESLLEEALRARVDAADAVHDTTAWPTPQMRHDAWLNRRLAIMVTGIGDVVLRRGADPRQFSCLRDLGDLFAWIRSIVVARSREIAQRSEPVPALTETDPTRFLSIGNDIDTWNRVWRRAIDSNAVRHRNLLVLSPWSVFPGQADDTAGFLDLLPLLEFADCCSFAGAPPLRDWNINFFRNLHQRAWAVLERRLVRQSFAEPV